MKRYKRIFFVVSIIITIIIIAIILNNNPAILNRLDSFVGSTLKKGDEMTDPLYHMRKKLEIGTIKIEKVWTQSGYGYALVQYTNDTKKTFKRGVTIRCFALDSKDRNINSNTRSFYVHEHGLIRPGFNGRVKVPVELFGIEMKSMSCEFMAD